jgi:hypothetical protein
MYYKGVSDKDYQRYAGGFVWHLPITSNYPEEGFKIPFENYYDDEDVFNNLLVVPDNPRNFKYASRHISNDDALGLVEQLINICEYLLNDLKDKSEDWDYRLRWLQSLLAELWKARGIFPGMLGVLQYIGQS